MNCKIGPRIPKPNRSGMRRQQAVVTNHNQSVVRMPQVRRGKEFNHN